LSRDRLFLLFKKEEKMVINGENYDYKTMKLMELFNQLSINSNNIVVEINGKIAEKSNFDNVVVNNQDKLEIVTFVGGG